MHGRFDEARRHAERLLAVEDVPQAELALWVLEKRDNRPDQAATHLARAHLPPVESLRFQFLGNVALGALDEAFGIMAQLRGLDSAVADHCAQVLRERNG